MYNEIVDEPPVREDIFVEINEIVEEPRKKSKFPVKEDIFVEINEIDVEPIVKRPRNIQQSFKLDSKLTPLGIR